MLWKCCTQYASKFGKLSSDHTWSRKWQHTPVFVPGKSHGQWQLAGLQSMVSQRVGHDWAFTHPVGIFHFLSRVCGRIYLCFVLGSAAVSYLDLRSEITHTHTRTHTHNVLRHRVTLIWSQLQVVILCSRTQPWVISSLVPWNLCPSLETLVRTLHIFSPII